VKLARNQVEREVVGDLDRAERFVDIVGGQDCLAGRIPAGGIT